MSTITGTVTSGVTLGQAGITSPLKINAGATVSNSTGPAIYASGSYANAVVVNHGAIIDTAGFDAVELKDGGSIGNTGLIQGYNGISISDAAGKVTNSGTIAGTGTGLGASGVYLGAGGSVANTGLLEGTGYFGAGVAISGAGAVTNSGVIQGYEGVYIGAAGDDQERRDDHRSGKAHSAAVSSSARAASAIPA